MSAANLNTMLSDGSLRQIRHILNEEIRPVDVARLLEASPPNERRILWSLIDDKNTGPVLQDINEEVREDILQSLGSKEIAATIEELSDDDITDILQQLPERVIHEVLQQMEAGDRRRIKNLLNYPEGTAGALMTTEVLTVRSNITLEVVMRYIRRTEQPIKTGSGKLAVTDKHNRLLGMLPLNALVQNPPTKRVAEVMDTESVTLRPKDGDEKVISVFERYNMISVPVTDSRKRFLGLVTVDDVFDLTLRRRGKTVLGMGAIQEDTFAPFTKVGGRRALWLGINLVTVLVASFFIGMFEDTLNEVVALAILMPVVAGMGGVAGLQSMTIMVRAQALGRINASNLPWLLMRESGLGFVSGMLWAVAAGALSLVWFDSALVGLALALGLMINMLLGSTLGVLIPLVLEKGKVDPADAGGVFLTTLTDIVGFTVFLGLATWLLHAG